VESASDAARCARYQPVRGHRVFRLLLKKLALRWSPYATVLLSSSGEADAEWRGPRRRHQCLALLVRGVAAAHGLNSRKGLRMSMIANLTVSKIKVLQGFDCGFRTWSGACCSALFCTSTVITTSGKISGSAHREPWAARR